MIQCACLLTQVIVQLPTPACMKLKHGVLSNTSKQTAEKGHATVIMVHAYSRRLAYVYWCNGDEEAILAVHLMATDSRTSR